MATVTLNEIVSKMRQAMALSEPDLDTSIGTPIRKILDVVGEVIAEAYVDTHLLDYQYDVYAKSGADLDEFVRLFGFARYPAKRATGLVTFERNAAATQDILIPMGSQVTTQGANPVIVQTTSPALLVQGATSVDVPVQAVEGGTLGNVPANSLRYRVSAFSGITSFSNPAALTGGADAESDSALRVRFIQTVFRNMAGTESMFLATALNDPSVSMATVLGATKTWRESLEVVANTTTSTIQGARHVYPDSEAFGPNLDGGGILIPGVHYEFNPTADPPTVTILDGDAAPDGVYELQFEYVPEASRNDPSNGVTNRIDIYVNGQRPTAATESLTFDSDRVFDTTVNSPMNRLNFRRADNSHPVAGNYFIAYAQGPVLDPSTTQSITINGVTYVENTDYFLVNDITREGGTSSSMSGIELKSAANGAANAIPPNGSSFQVDYLFNAVPGDVEQAVREWRLITTDVKVHQATPVYLDLHLAIVYGPGFNEGNVRPALEAGLNAYISSIGFSGLVQVSDLLEVAARTPGVDAVRFLTSSDHATKYAVQRVTADGATVLQTYATSVAGQIRRALDVQVAADEYPMLHQVALTTKARNTFGAV